MNFTSESNSGQLLKQPQMYHSLERNQSKFPTLFQGELSYYQYYYKSETE